MASFWYTKIRTKLGKAGLDLQEAGDDVRVLLVMANTDADTAEDVEFVGGLTLDEFDGTNYARKSLASQTITDDLPNDYGEFDATDLAYTSLGVGARALVGAVVYKFVTNDADSPIVAFIDLTGEAQPNGGDWTLQWNGEGILQI